jgi:hypothetical protein
MVPSLHSGARGKILVNGRPMAFVTNVSVNVSHRVQPVHTFGAPNARSVEPLSYSCSVSLGTVVPINDASGNPVNTSAIAYGLEPLIQLMTTAEDVTIEILDTVTNRSVASVRNCRFTSRSFSLAASSLANANLNLVGIYDAASGNAPTQLGLS